MKIFRLLLLLALYSVHTAFSQKTAPRNGGFEEELKHWTVIKKGKADAAARAKSGYSGTLGLFVKNSEESSFAQVRSSKIRVKGGTSYLLNFQAMMIQGDSFIVAISYSDHNGKLYEIPGVRSPVMQIKTESRNWKRYELFTTAPANAEFAEIIFQTIAGTKVRFDIDDVSFSPAVSKNKALKEKKKAKK